MKSRLHKYRLTVSYDGTQFHGWQVQSVHRTVQGELQAGFQRLTGEDRVHMMGSGRTDRGVHARAQVAHFSLRENWTPERLMRSCPSYLPRDLRVTQVKRVDPDFHAQKSAVGKEYRYRISNKRICSPFDRLYRLHVWNPLDTAAMQAAADVLVGEHDFAAFSANPMREMEGTVRTVYRLVVLKRGSEVILRVIGSGFLYKMVRSLAGHLIRVGLGKEDAVSTQEILASKLRTARVPSAQAHGLFLWKVYYPGDKKDW